MGALSSRRGHDVAVAALDGAADKIQILWHHDALRPAAPVSVVAGAAHAKPASGVLLHARHRDAELIDRPEQFSAARLVNDLRERTDPPRDVRRRLTACFDHDNDDSLEADRSDG